MDIKACAEMFNRMNDQENANSNYNDRPFCSIYLTKI